MSYLTISNDPNNKPPTRIDVKIEYTRIVDEVRERYVWDRLDVQILPKHKSLPISINNPASIEMVRVDVRYGYYQYTYIFDECGKELMKYYKQYGSLISISIIKGDTRPIVRVNDVVASSCVERDGVVQGNMTYADLGSVLPCCIPCFCYFWCCSSSPYLADEMR